MANALYVGHTHEAHHELADDADTLLDELGLRAPARVDQEAEGLHLEPPPEAVRVLPMLGDLRGV